MSQPANKPVRGLGVFVYGGLVYLATAIDKEHFAVSKSEDGFDFELARLENTIEENLEPSEIIEGSWRFVKVDSGLFLLVAGEKGVEVVKLESLSEWKLVTRLNQIQGPAEGISDFKYKESNYILYGTGKIKGALTKDFVNLSLKKKTIIEAESKMDLGEIEIEAAVNNSRGVLVFYHSWSETKAGGRHYRVSAAMLDRENPDTVLWRAKKPVWEQGLEWDSEKVRFIGAVNYLDREIAYWQVGTRGIYAVVYGYHHVTYEVSTKNVSLGLEKHVTNPIIAPRGENAWEAFNTFNPAAIYEGGKVHILYRAQGFDWSSSIGYASSTDGVAITERLSQPIYTPKEAFEVKNKKVKRMVDNSISGGGLVGCEDPRITRVGDRIYMTYVAYDGATEPRIALTSISVEDFLNHRWMWERAVLISPPGIIDKSAVIFPEKVNGKYVIMHRVFPDILIDYVDDLNFDGKTWLAGKYRIPIRLDHWDSRKIGAGAPPLKTKDGWLLIYYAVDERDAGRYKIGAMLLDLDDPTKVLHRTNNPILEPDERYENEGFKAGVAYPCGAVIIDKTLYVYYGGADTVVCVATADLDHFLSELKYSEMGKLTPAIIKKVG